MPFNAVNLSEPGDEARGIGVAMVALRWNSKPIPARQLQERAASAVQAVDAKYNKDVMDVMDVKILEVSEEQQYVQLAVRANFTSRAESHQMAIELKQEFGELPKKKWFEFWK